MIDVPGYGALLDYVAEGIRNEDMPAGSPMVYACIGCGTPIWTPECWVARPKLCERCGGEWSEGPWGFEVPE